MLDACAGFTTQQAEAILQVMKDAMAESLDAQSKVVRRVFAHHALSHWQSTDLHVFCVLRGWLAAARDQVGACGAQGRAVRARVQLDAKVRYDDCPPTYEVIDLMLALVCSPDVQDIAQRHSRELLERDFNSLKQDIRMLEKIDFDNVRMEIAELEKKFLLQKQAEDETLNELRLSMEKVEKRMLQYAVGFAGTIMAVGTAVMRLVM
jgi:hypothetical protein